MSLDLASPVPVLEVRDLRTVLHTRDGPVHAVNGVSFSVGAGELLGIVGESGSGKSMTMMSLLGLLPVPPGRPAGGSVRLAGRELMTMRPAELGRVRGRRIGVVFQDPMTSLNPVFTIGFQIIEPLRHHLGLGRRAARARAAELLGRVGIAAPASRLDDYPHQFSGGMRQRVMIAIALACGPQVLIADEPTTALDVTVQAQILDLVGQLRAELGMAVVWVTHDLGVVAGIADRVLVMYAGQIVEQAPVRALFATPRHPYTQALLATLPDRGVETDRARAGRLATIPGEPPSLAAPPVGCPFRPRCPFAFARCFVENPPLMPAEDGEAGDGHAAACWWDIAGARPRDV